MHPFRLTEAASHDINTIARVQELKISAELLMSLQLCIDLCQCKISLPTQVYMLVYEYLGYRRQYVCNMLVCEA